MIRLKYGNTNTFYSSGLLVDTGYAGLMQPFYRALKENGLRMEHIQYVLATHYHPDHMGLISELMKQGVKLLLMDVQREYVHFSDHLFRRDGLPYVPIPEASATILTCSGSRAFLAGLHISGEILYTPSHSRDSVSLVTDDGDACVGDLEPFEYIEAYGDNAALQKDWEQILAHHPRRILYAHRPESVLG